MTHKKKPQKVMPISAETGRIVTKQFAKSNPGKTVELKVNQLTDKEKALGGLYVIIEGVAQGTGMSLKQIVAKVKRRFGV